MKLTASHVETCLPCYWPGHHLPHLQVAVWRDMTLAELKEGLHAEMRDGCFGGSDERAMDHHPEYEAFYDAAKTAIDAITLKDPADDKLFTSLEPRDEDDDGEEVYAFFLFIDEDE